MSLLNDIPRATMEAYLLKAFGKQPVTIRAAIIGGAFLVITTVFTVVGGPAASAAFARLWTDEAYLDLLVLDGAPAALVDLTIVNPSSDPLFVRELEFQVDSITSLVAACCALAPSSTYHLRLDGTRRVPLSYVIPTDQAERFRVQIILPGEGIETDAVFGRLVVSTGSGTELASPPFGFLISPAIPADQLTLTPQGQEPSYELGWRRVLRDPFPRLNIIEVIP